MSPIECTIQYANAKHTSKEISYQVQVFSSAILMIKEKCSFAKKLQISNQQSTWC